MPYLDGQLAMLVQPRGCPRRLIDHQALDRHRREGSRTVVRRRLARAATSRRTLQNRPRTSGTATRFARNRCHQSSDRSLAQFRAPSPILGPSQRRCCRCRAGGPRPFARGRWTRHSAPGSPGTCHAESSMLTLRVDRYSGRVTGRSGHATRPPRRLRFSCAAPLPHRTDCLFAGGQGSRADPRVRRPGTLTCARCPAVRSGLDAVPEACDNPAAVWCGPLQLPWSCRPRPGGHHRTGASRRLVTVLCAGALVPGGG